MPECADWPAEGADRTAQSQAQQARDCVGAAAKRLRVHHAVGCYPADVSRSGRGQQVPPLTGGAVTSLPGLKCGGSDGFSGISANPAIGHTADLLVALGGRAILSEFPELCGVEQGLINRATRKEVSDRFARLMRDYQARARSVGSGFEMNPSPGNI